MQQQQLDNNLLQQVITQGRLSRQIHTLSINLGLIQSGIQEACWTLNRTSTFVATVIINKWNKTFRECSKMWSRT